MPLSNAVLDFHALGIHDTPEGPRQQVVLVAAQRDMVQRLLAAVRDAGLRPEGIDLSAFALIRSLYRPDPEHAGRVLYLNVDGLTNMAIAEGTICRFTRVVGGGIEAMASELAERRGDPPGGRPRADRLRRPDCASRARAGGADGGGGSRSRARAGERGRPRGFRLRSLTRSPPMRMRPRVRRIKTRASGP